MKGLGVSKGLGMGEAYLYTEEEMIINRVRVGSVEDEIQRLFKALKKAKDQIDDLYKLSLKSLKKDEAAIFLAHKMILDDPEFIGKIEDKIREELVNVEWAVDQVTNYFMEIFENMEDEYIKARGYDIRDVSKRLLRILLNTKSLDLSSLDRDTIIIGKDLPASYVAQMDKKSIKGLISEAGGSSSHNFIIARSLGIPAVSGVGNILQSINNGDYLIIDGDTGHIIINPSEEEKKSYRKKELEAKDFKDRIKLMIGRPTISKDGHRVYLEGNIGGEGDLKDLLENDGEGVGLFRTEFLFMDRDRVPTEEEQFIAYKNVAEKLQDRPLTIRTLDVGGDKELPYLNLPKELNPFLGYRAIRISLDRLDIFKSQLRAILRASQYGNIRIMFPMISSIEELRKAKDILDQVKRELKSENIGFKQDLQLGIMVEIPGVAIHSRAFAKEVDFFSIGTNDLIQYALAVDRGDGRLANLYNPYHPGVLKLIYMTIKNGHDIGIPVGMCGEVAGNQKLIPLLLAMGLDEFSMTSSSILEVRYLIANTSKKEMEVYLEEILNLPSGEEVLRFLNGL